MEKMSFYGLKKKMHFTANSLITLFILTACQNGQEMETRERLFKAQTRLLELEKQLQNKSQASDQRESALSLNVAEARVRQNAYESDIQSIRGELDTFRHFLGISDLRADELDKKRLDNQLVSMKNNSKEIKSVQDRIKQIEERQKQILKNLEKIAKSKLASSTKVATQTSKKSTEINSLASANKAFRAKQYKELVSDLPALMKKKKGSQKNSLNYLYAESLYNLGRVNEAALAFDSLSKTEKTPSKVRKIYLRMGDCFRRMGDSTTAKIYYEELIEKYPRASEAIAASSHLSKLKTKKG